MVGVVNRRFATLNILDIDYMHYKGDFFQARTQKEELLKTCLQLNCLTQKTYSAYHKAHQRYEWRSDPAHSYHRQKSKKALSMPTRVATNSKSPTKDIKSEQKNVERRTSQGTRSHKVERRAKGTSPEHEEFRELSTHKLDIFK